MCDNNQSNDPVNHPSHYLKAAITIEPIELTARLNACLGQAVNYIVRAPYKNNFVEDLKKAVFYLKKYDELMNTPYFQRGVSLSNWHLAQLFAKKSRDPLTRDVLGALFISKEVSSISIAAAVQIIEDAVDIQKRNKTVFRP